MSNRIWFAQSFNPFLESLEPIITIRIFRIILYIYVKEPHHPHVDQKISTQEFLTNRRTDAEDKANKNKKNFFFETTFGIRTDFLKESFSTVIVVTVSCFGLSVADGRPRE